MAAKLGKDNPQRPGFLGRQSIKTVEGRGGLTQNETRFGQNGKSTQIDLPKGGSKGK